MCPSPFDLLELIDARSSDEELIMFLGGRKVGDAIPLNVITDVDPFVVEPWDSPENIWYLYDSEDSRADIKGSIIEVNENGYWRSVNKLGIVTGTPSKGRKTTREFFLGRPPIGYRTGWIMHEYQVDQKTDSRVTKTQDRGSLCRVFWENDPITNSKRQFNCSSADRANGEYLESRLLSLLNEEEHNPSRNSAGRLEVVIGLEQSRSTSSKRHPHALTTDDSVEDMHAAFNFSRRDYLELNDLCAMESSSSSQNNSTACNTSKVKGEGRLSALSERHPENLAADDSVEDMQAASDILKGDYLELKDLCSLETTTSSPNNSTANNFSKGDYLELKDLYNMETNSSGSNNSTANNFSKGDYLELNDLYNQETSSSSSDNSSIMSIDSDDYFDPDELLRDLENARDLELEEDHVDVRFNVSAPVESNKVVIRPPCSGLVQSSDNNHLVEKEQLAPCSVPGEGQASSKAGPSSSVVPDLALGSSKGSRASETSRGSQDDGIPQGMGSRSGSRIAKFGKKYFCFTSV